jgi:hypothetical protein
MLARGRSSILDGGAHQEAGLRREELATPNFRGRWSYRELLIPLSLYKVLRYGKRLAEESTIATQLCDSTPRLAKVN